jgi:hypothetical protein
MLMKLLWIINVGFEVTDQLLIFFSFVRYWRKSGGTMRQTIRYSSTSREPVFQLEEGKIVQ